MARDPIDPPPPGEESEGKLEASLRHELNPLFSNPPDPGPIPETLRRSARLPADPDHAYGREVEMGDEPPSACRQSCTHWR